MGRRARGRFRLLPSDDVDSTVGFATWLARSAGESDPARTLGAGRVHSTYRWIVEDDQVLGAIALRHELTESLLRTRGSCRLWRQALGARSGADVLMTMLMRGSILSAFGRH
ncbi:hypothetical protein [Jatrophihabitans lederbergiae]|uniref:GNAT family N-acetyltransferase n=1 Tax=Jatrophihabitans lederbergiae TaxID=3075547 RepID=A0ABU2JFG0_9ACTN|nr:hypothetical protein [Jatrophihabitans sp. DSM 44399]MDT0263662.1 hypothetical protein [Jatrophihabitans sp. DSM 44399]